MDSKYVIGSRFLNEKKRQFGSKESQLFCRFDPAFLRVTIIIEKDYVNVLSSLVL